MRAARIAYRISAVLAVTLALSVLTALVGWFIVSWLATNMTYAPDSPLEVVMQMAAEGIPQSGAGAVLLVAFSTSLALTAAAIVFRRRALRLEASEEEQ